MSFPDVSSRLGGRIGGILKMLPKCPARLGGLSFAGTSLYPPDKNWMDEEHRILHNQLTPIIEKGRKTNGKES